MKISTKFALNKMQLDAKSSSGLNLILSAPTGSGKTEAILLAIKNDSKKIAYFLPTITSCNFMYKRLVHDFGHILNITLDTSKFKEQHMIKGDATEVSIYCPDGEMIDYLKGEDYISNADTYILDEFDNYPEMVQSVIFNHIENYKNNKQYIVASATLSNNIIEKFKELDFNIIEFKQDLILEKHRIKIINKWENIQTIARMAIRNKKKIGFIMNSIGDMENISYFLNLKNINHLVLHANLTDYERSIAEDRLFSGDYEVIVSNDLISMSIDVDFDILVTQVTDKENLFLQRLGRNNRRNKEINFTNLFILNHGMNKDVPFIDSYQSEELFEKYSEYKSLYYKEIRELYAQLPEQYLPTIQEILEYWDYLRNNNRELVLRKVPLTFIYNCEIINKLGETIKTKKYFKQHGMEVKYANCAYSEEQYNVYVSGGNPEPDLVYFGDEYKIIGKDEKGHFIIEDNRNCSYIFCPDCNNMVSENEFHFGEWRCYDCINEDDNEEYEESYPGCKDCGSHLYDEAQKAMGYCYQCLQEMERMERIENKFKKS